MTVAQANDEGMYQSKRIALLIFKNNEMRKELLVLKLIRNNIKLYSWLRRRNKSVSGDEVTTLSLFAAAAGGGVGEGGSEE